MNAPITASNRVGVHPAQQPADRGLRRAPTVHTQRDGDLVGQVSDPLGDRDERPRPGHDRTHRRGEHHHQPVPHAAAFAWINHPTSTLRRPGASTTGSGSSTPPTWSATAAIDKDADAGSALFR